MSSSNDARLHVVSEGWEEEQQRAQTANDRSDQFLARLTRLETALDSIQGELAHNKEARMRLRIETLEQAAQFQDSNLANIVRMLLPDTSDPLNNLLDAAIDFLNQLKKVAEQRATLQSGHDDLVALFTISPAVIRSALLGVTFPLEDKIAQLVNVSLDRDQVITQEDTDNGPSPA